MVITIIAFSQTPKKKKQELISSAEEMASAQSTPQQMNEAKNSSAPTEGPGATEENQAVGDNDSNA